MKKLIRILESLITKLKLKYLTPKEEIIGFNSYSKIKVYSITITKTRISFCFGWYDENDTYKAANLWEENIILPNEDLLNINLVSSIVKTNIKNYFLDNNLTWK